VCNEFRKKHKDALLDYNKDIYSRWSEIKRRFAKGALLWGNSGSLCVLAGVFDITIVVWSDDGVQITPTPYKCKCEIRCPTQQCQQRPAKFAQGYDKDGRRAVQVHAFRDGKFSSTYMDPLLMLERPEMYERMVHLSHQNGNHFDALFNKWWATIELPTEFQAQYTEFRREQQQAPQVRRIPCVFGPLADARQQLQVLQAKHEHLQVAQVEQQKFTLMAVQVVQGKQQETITELKGEVEALQQKKRKRKRGKGNKKRGKRSSAQKRISAKKNKSSNEPNKLKGVIVHEQEAFASPTRIKRRLPLPGPWSRANEVVHGVPPSMIGHSWQRQHEELHTLKKMFKKT